MFIQNIEHSIHTPYFQEKIQTGPPLFSWRRKEFVSGKIKNFGSTWIIPVKAKTFHTCKQAQHGQTMLLKSSIALKTRHHILPWKFASFK